jgi:hypothetical protein
MVDPLTALGVAGNIVQFIDFGSRLLSQSLEVYSSAQGATKGTENLESITKHLRDLCYQLVARDPSPNRSSNALDEIAGGCLAIGNELATALSGLKSVKHSHWSSFKVALATTWKKREIEEICSRLEQYKSQLTLHLLVEANAIRKRYFYLSFLAKPSCKY